jgi:phosphatidylserine/phosphatidylglycerophosphate/cardiolipin synthase-like enzyme
MINKKKAPERNEAFHHRSRELNSQAAQYCLETCFKTFENLVKTEDEKQIRTAYLFFKDIMETKGRKFPRSLTRNYFDYLKNIEKENPCLLKAYKNFKQGLENSELLK